MNITFATWITEWERAPTIEEELDAMFIIDNQDLLNVAPKNTISKKKQLQWVTNQVQRNSSQSCMFLLKHKVQYLVRLRLYCYQLTGKEQWCQSIKPT